MTDSSIFTRAAVLAWANGILQRDFAAFSEVPAEELALLLYGIVNSPPSSASGKDIAELGEPVTLQGFQFMSPEQRGGAASVPENVLLSNAEHALRLLRRVSSDVAARAKAADGTAQHQLPHLTLSDATSAEDWIAGKAFVEELKVWRWLRAFAEFRGLSQQEVQRPIQQFLHGAGGEVGHASHVSASGTRSGKQSKPSAAEAASTAPPLSETPSRRPSRKSRRAESDSTEAEGPISTLPQVEQPPVKAIRTETATAAASDSKPPATATVGSPTPVTAVRMGDCTTESSDALWRAQKALRTALGRSCSGEGPCDESGTNASARSSHDHKATLPDDMCIEDPSRRDRSVACSTCPALLALALEGNLKRINDMEKLRRRALAACVNKDLTELLAALSDVA